MSKRLKEDPTVAKAMMLAAAKLLFDSWRDINYKYEGLTLPEQRLITRATFNDRVRFFQRQGWIG